MGIWKISWSIPPPHGRENARAALRRPEPLRTKTFVIDRIEGGGSSIAQVGIANTSEVRVRDVRNGVHTLMRALG